jgi:hypothetical protein
MSTNDGYDRPVNQFGTPIGPGQSAPPTDPYAPPTGPAFVPPGSLLPASVTPPGPGPQQRRAVVTVAVALALVV